MSETMNCYKHDFVPTNCIHCGGFLGEVCRDCGHWSDGGDFTASQSDIWCNCADSVSNIEVLILAVFLACIGSILLIDKLYE